MSTININQLTVLFELVIDKLKRDYVDNVPLKVDEYGLISTDEWNNFHEIPQPVVGSLKHDVEYLEKAIAAREIYTYSDFDRLASVLRMISEMQAPVNDK